MVKSASLGFPRIGAHRELKKVLELYWKGKASERELKDTAKKIREINWRLQSDKGIDLIPSNDFSLYDTVLDTSCLVGAIPERYNQSSNSHNFSLETYFAMARGGQIGGKDVVAMEMTKWFDTNYHYIVPEFKADTTFKLTSTKIIDEFKEGKDLGILTRPVILGPISFLLLGKSYTPNFNQLDLNNKLIPVYEQVFSELKKLGATELQLDEPCLSLDLSSSEIEVFKKCYEKINFSGLSVQLTSYFESIADKFSFIFDLPFSTIHLDLVSDPTQLADLGGKNLKNKKLSLGLVNGRNIWKNDLRNSLDIVEAATRYISKDHLIISSSCSLLHSPIDLSFEKKLDSEIKSWLSYATDKLNEIATLAKLISGSLTSGEELIAENQRIIKSRKESSKTTAPNVSERLRALTSDDSKRVSKFRERIKAQKRDLNLPLLPTTTIGSFPQTSEIRSLRALLKKGKISETEYDEKLESLTKEVISWQEEIGIDVLVHGEYERNDMVEYFGEQLYGFTFTENGWVQSYGSRCVKPPIIYGDVYRKAPMTVRWSKFAQQNSKKLVKGMLTGPVTMLQWSFVRDDQEVSTTCRQIALALRDEVRDLEAAGIKIIQIDEPAFREGLPLRHKDRPEYLKWAVESFKISSSGISDSTQIHTHMCYSEFNDIIDSIADLDADVISIETSRSAMELLEAFTNFKYPNEIGPGVYDIHSPRIPKVEEMKHLIKKALAVLEPEQVWVNPDCGLKTRSWEEVKPSLINMVKAAKDIRQELTNN
jgi:5-methyltetrahydropteroyltriglutamate--homocysteine methyltransferase